MPSVYQRALGDEFNDLDPRLQRYFGPIPAGMVGRGVGVYDVAGSRLSALRTLLALLAWRHVLFAEFARDVPFTVENRPGRGGTLSAVRTFGFARVERVMEDTMYIKDGRLVDRLGARRGLEVALTAEVRDGSLQLTSGRFWWRLRVFGRSLRIPLPRVATMTLDERTHPADGERQQVDVRIVAPALGEVFRYSGSFTYGYVAP